MIKPIKNILISEQVFGQLRDMIFRGEMAPGEKLMSERDMTAAFGVSRSTVRTAIQKLVDQGLVQNRRGAGTFVRADTGGLEHEPLIKVIGGEDFDLLDFLEVRQVLECHSAYLAAKRATDDDIRMLAKNIQTIEQTTSVEVTMEADVGFHMNLAFATHNRVYTHLMRSFYDVLQYGLSRIFSVVDPQEAVRQVLAQHTKVFEAVRRHDPDAAREAMDSHITYILELCREHWL
jgi:GntR family transcriptional repressor for pyruvate dehydrogenase complex